MLGKNNPQPEPAPRLELVEPSTEPAAEVLSIYPPESQTASDRLAAPKDPTDFLSEHAEDLVVSHRLWRLVAEDIGTFRDTTDERHIRSHFLGLYRSQGCAVSAKTLDQTVRRTIVNTTAHLWRTARYLSQYGPGSPRFQPAPHIQARVAQNMRFADERSAVILDGLTTAFSEDFDYLSLFADQYAAGAAENDPVLQELRSVCAADWYRPDGGESRLRQWLADFSQNPKAFLSLFSDEVAAETKNKQLLLIQNMARYAILARHEPDDDTAISSQIQVSYGFWDRVDGISEAFQAFKAKRVQDIESALTSIVGPRKSNNIRYYVAKNDPLTIENMPDAIAAGSTRRDRRKVQRELDKTQTMDGEAFNKQLQTDIQAERDRPVVRQISVGKEVQGKGICVEPMASAEDVAAYFKMDHNEILVGDVAKMVNLLQQRPINRATRPIVSAKKRRISGKDEKVWRLAPEKCTDLQIHGDNRYCRVVYTFTPKELVILDVATHQDYEKTWL